MVDASCAHVGAVRSGTRLIADEQHAITTAHCRLLHVRKVSTDIHTCSQLASRYSVHFKFV
jgi:hypothetical protein